MLDEIFLISIRLLQKSLKLVCERFFINWTVVVLKNTEELFFRYRKVLHGNFDIQILFMCASVSFKVEAGKKMTVGFYILVSKGR